MTEFLSRWQWRGPLHAPGLKNGSRREMERIVLDVAARAGIPIEDVMGRSRSRSVVAARQDAMHAAYATGKYSFPAIGDFFERDHTTVMHAVSAAQERQCASASG